MMTPKPGDIARSRSSFLTPPSPVEKNDLLMILGQHNDNDEIYRVEMLTGESKGKTTTFWVDNFELIFNSDLLTSFDKAALIAICAIL